jgi:hypothetical protein
MVACGFSIADFQTERRPCRLQSNIPNLRSAVQKTEVRRGLCNHSETTGLPRRPKNCNWFPCRDGGLSCLPWLPQCRLPPPIRRINEWPPSATNRRAAATGPQTGYTGRTGLFELLPVTEPVRRLIRAGRPPQEIQEAAVKEGMVPFRRSAMFKVGLGETSLEEVFRVVPAEYLIED